VSEREGFVSEDVCPSGTYKTLAEQREVLTPAEERFERTRQTIRLFLGPVAFLEAIPIPETAVLSLALPGVIALIPIMAGVVGFV
jgi:hypothetical protein